jgi:hypothetical protein
MRPGSSSQLGHMPVIDVSRLPAPPFDHLIRLTDDTGVLEHAEYSVPRIEHGYCVDDAARALAVVVREPHPSTDLADLAVRYLSLIRHAQTPDGLFHNRLGFDRRFEDAPGLGDWWGRALWALGVTARHSEESGLETAAAQLFEVSARHRPPHLRALAHAAVGAAELLTVRPDHGAARELLAAAADAIRRPGTDPDWPWPEPRLAYANALLPEALLAAGDALADDALVADGLALLRWLLEIETRDGHLSVTPRGGWGAGEPRSTFDQQPIEVAAIAEACVRAYRLTGERRWAQDVYRAAAWFMGANDLGVTMWDAETGGGFDGLTPSGANRNQGAESTIALIATLQQAHQVA